MTVATKQGNDIKILAEIPAFHSLGTLYNDARRFFNQIMKFVSLRNDDTYTLPVFTHNHTHEEQETHAGVLKFLADKFGALRDPESEITQLHKDLTTSLQSILQTCQL